MENACVFPVRMCNRRDAIPPINVEFGVLVRYVLTVSACVEYMYNIMSLTAVLWF